MIEHVIFDVGEVLFNGFYKAENHISRVVESPVTNKQLQTLELQQFFSGNIPENELWQRMSKRFDWKVDVELLKSAVRANFTEVQGTREVVADLRECGKCRSIDILSVHGKEWVEYIQDRYDFHHLFDIRHYSCYTKISKPQPQAFLLMARALGVNPDQCLMIDDCSVNIVTAIQLGFATHLFTNAENLRTELRSLRLIA